MNLRCIAMKNLLLPRISLKQIFYLFFLLISHLLRQVHYKCYVEFPLLAREVVLWHTFLFDYSYLLWLCDSFMLYLDDVTVEVGDFLAISEQSLSK